MKQFHRPFFWVHRTASGFVVSAGPRTHSTPKGDNPLTPATECPLWDNFFADRLECCTSRQGQFGPATKRVTEAEECDEHMGLHGKLISSIGGHGRRCVCVVDAPMRIRAQNCQTFCSGDNSNKRTKSSRPRESLFRSSSSCLPGEIAERTKWLHFS